MGARVETNINTLDNMKEFFENFTFEFLSS